MATVFLQSTNYHVRMFSNKCSVTSILDTDNQSRTERGKRVPVKHYHGNVTELNTGIDFVKHVLRLTNVIAPLKRKNIANDRNIRIFSSYKTLLKLERSRTMVGNMNMMVI
jgi:hypothetical protein